MKAFCISAISSNQGKTILTTALLHYFRRSARPFKIGPDYIDPQFHTAICNKESINLDTFIMNENQVKWIFNNYSNQDISILEGVMGFYDGLDKGCSAYDVSKLLNIPTILLLDGSGSYITISAVLKGLKTYKNDNTIKAVVLNKLSSSMHFNLIKKQIESDFNDVKVLGWIKKDLTSLKNTHLGLDLCNANKNHLQKISNEVLQNIDLNEIDNISRYKKEENINYPFEKVQKVNRKITIIKDENFSFVYHDNIMFLKEVFQEVKIISSCNNETIDDNSDVVYLPGGYIETNESYNRINNSRDFMNSLVEHARSKYIYAECAGLLYLSNKVDDKIMSGILNINFKLNDKRSRLGYYFSSNGLKGHAFHYTTPVDPPRGSDILSKKNNSKGEVGSWKKNKVYGTYLHTMFRNNFNILKDYFGI